jgi:hypothetical protein
MVKIPLFNAIERIVLGVLGSDILFIYLFNFVV